MNRCRIVFLLISFFFCFNVTFAQEQEKRDSLVRLIEASSAQLVQIDSVPYRKIIGPARFLHNDTYLLCDTASWNVRDNVIYAIGHVQIIQQNTYLTGDELRYIIASNLAELRGSRVQLVDKERNVLRTCFIDYNTKDSVALFFNGGVMRSKEGNVIEGFNGRYDSKIKLFSFYDNVQMFTDSICIISNKIDYNTDLNRAFFGNGTYAWQSTNMLRTNDGLYDRNTEQFYFFKDNYIYTDSQEIWADTLNYNKNSGNSDLFGNVQITDTTQSTIFLGDRARYNRDSTIAELTKNPVVAMYSFENGVADTLFLSADTLRYYSKKYCDIDSSLISVAKERRKLTETDPIETIKKESQKSIEKQRSQNNNKQLTPQSTIGDTQRDTTQRDTTQQNTVLQNITQRDTTQRDTIQQNTVLQDTTQQNTVLQDITQRDTTQRDTILNSVSQSESLLEDQKDTSQVRFIDAWKNVKIYGRNLQGLCDSLIYTGVDSIARFYHNPVLWNDIKNQFSADTIFVVMKKDSLYKANLVNNAFIVTKEDSIHFNQVKSMEMMAYFKNNDVYRYDALGGTSAIFYLEEDSIITLMNQKEAKILSALINNRKVQKIRYYEQLKSDVSPVFNLSIEDQRLRGFNWRGDEQPKSRFELTDRKIHESEKEASFKVKIPDYPQYRFFFPDDNNAVISYRNEIDSLRRAKILERDKKISNNSTKNKFSLPDSLSIKANQIIPKDSTNASGTDSLVLESTFKANLPINDSTLVSPNKEQLTKKELRKERRLEKKQKKIEDRNARRRQRLEKKEARKRVRIELRAKKKAKKTLKEKKMPIVYNI